MLKLLIKETCYCRYKQENDVVKVKSIAVNDHAALFVAENGQLWASGNQSQIDVDSIEPRKVKFFEGRTVSAVACGSNFNVVAVRKASKAVRDDTDSENELEEEVFVNSCPQCLNAVSLSPLSFTSSDTCPPGLHPHQFSEDRSTNSISALSIASKEHDIVLPTDIVKKDQNSKLIGNEEECSNNPIGSDKEEKRNVIFINTEAARQFLTKQLSWVSSYGSIKEEVPLENMEKPTGLIKQNMTNVATLVYEGVKNVGGKVVTLSRHMSGSSDINEFKEGNNEYIEEHGEDCLKAATSLPLSLRCEEFPWSSSTGSSEHELSQQGLNERINTLTCTGSNILSTELWTWGDVQYGQLGTGDIIKRSRPVLVTKLSNTGLRKISCGEFHVLALTLDGRAYTWGRNNHKQVTLDPRLHQSSPQIFTTQVCPNERAKDIAAGRYHSLIMMHHGLYFIGQSR